MAELNEKPSQRPTGVMSTPTSPKTKSAPTTPCSGTPPCRVTPPCSGTPTAFHQHTSHFNSQQNPSQASTLPPDIRMNMSDHLSTTRLNLPKARDVFETQQVTETQEASNGSGNKVVDEQLLDQLIKNGDSSLKLEDFEEAIEAYSNCIELARSNNNEQYLKKNFRVYIQRAEAYFNSEKYSEAVDDSIRAREINPECMPCHAYCLQGKSLVMLGDHARALAVFSYGLAQDPTNNDLLNTLVSFAPESDFRNEFVPKYNTLKSMKLDREPFFVVAVLGQELLLQKHEQHAAVILEQALRIGTDDKRLKSSVLSTISYAYCIMKDYVKAVRFMQQELKVEEELEDVNGQCRVLTNLGCAYYKMRRFDKSLEEHRKQVRLAFGNNLYSKASMGLNAIGHVHMAKNDFTAALTSHTNCLQILRKLGDNSFNQFEELLSLGLIHTILNDYKAAEERYMESTTLYESLRHEEYNIGHIMMNFNLAYLELSKHKFNEAKNLYTEVLELAQNLPDKQKAQLIKKRASTGIDQALKLEMTQCLRENN